MATSRIKIEVDYEKARVKVDDLKISFDQLGTKVVATRNRITKAIGSTNDAVKGSLKALMRERDEWKNIQASLSTTSAAYAKYQGQIDKLDAKIAKITDTRNKEQKALKNSANGLRAQISAMQTEMDNRILSNRQYRIANEQLQILKDKLDALTDTRKEHEIVQRGSIAHYEQEIQVRMDMLRNMNLEAEAIERIEKEITSLNNRKGEAVAKTKSLSKAMEGTSSSAGAAGATVTEFGRTIGDAPFGLMGMANNLQQLSQQFVDLQTKSGGTNNAIKSILQTMAGPAGFVVAINIVTSALVAYNMRKDKAKQKTEEFNESLLLEKNTLEALILLYNESADAAEGRANVMGALTAADDKYAEALNAVGISEEKRSKLTDAYLKDRNALNAAEDKRNKLAEKYKEQLKLELISEEELNKEREKINKIEDADTQGKKLFELGQKITRNNELKAILGEVADATIEVDKAEKQLNKTLGNSEMDKFMEKLREFEKERDMSRALRGFEGSAAIEKEIRLLQADYGAAVRKFGNDSVQAKEALLAVDQKRLELEETLYQEGVERAEKEAEDAQERLDEEKERKEELRKLNEDLLNDLEAQFDDYGLIRLKQQEDQAIAEAKALGASVETLMNITKYYEGERKKVIDKVNEEIANNDKKVKEEALKENEKKLEEYFDKEIELMKARTDSMSEVMSNFSNLLDELGSISEARYERQLNNLKNERDIINADNTLTKEEKVAQLTEIQQQENEIQTKRIKAERDMFTLKQTITLAEMIMKQKAMIQEQIMLSQLSVAKANLAAQNIGLTAVEETGEATMSIGTFMKQLGPLGIAAFALSIGGVIASIVSARRKARAEIAGLSTGPVSVGGGSSAAAVPSVPNFNVVGASSQNQLAQAISGSQQQPVKAYVVSSDVTTAQEMDRKIIEGASI
jgi:myosin heavy subunit